MGPAECVFSTSHPVVLCLVGYDRLVAARRGCSGGGVPPKKNMPSTTLVWLDQRRYGVTFPGLAISVRPSEFRCCPWGTVFQDWGRNSLAKDTPSRVTRSRRTTRHRPLLVPPMHDGPHRSPQAQYQGTLKP